MGGLLAASFLSAVARFACLGLSLPRAAARRRRQGWAGAGWWRHRWRLPGHPLAAPSTASRGPSSVSAVRPAPRVVAGDAGRAVEQGELTVGILMDADSRLDPVMTQGTVGQFAA